MKNNSEHNRYEINEWKEDSIDTWTASIYVAGDMQTTRTKCRELCFPKGLCVALDKVEFVYAGGVETGIRIGMIQYPPFPEEQNSLLNKAIEIGKIIAEVNYQWSFTVVTSNKTYFLSRRKK